MMDATRQEAFDKFWKESWPKGRRIDKKKAAEQWARIAPELYPAIFAAVARQKKQESWLKQNCAFVPYPHRWLRDRRWEDEVTLPEDLDAETLIEALSVWSSVPPDFPRRIMERFMRMATRTRVNWPLLHNRIEVDPGSAEKIKAEYLTTT
jgi:hypothetical protein